MNRVRATLSGAATRCVVLLDGHAPFALEPDGSGGRGARTVAVLDDACERLERVASTGCGPGPVGRWQRRALLRSLRAAEPVGGDALDLLGLGRNATADARACLVRTRATPASVAALEALLDDGARLVAVTTPARLLAGLHRRHPVPRLFVARTGVDERHVLVVDGVPCFARTVARDASVKTAPEAAVTSAAVADSLEHLAGRYAAGRIDVAGIGLDDAALDACRALAHVGEVRAVSRTDLATTLARRIAERTGPGPPRHRVADVSALWPATRPGASPVRSGLGTGTAVPRAAAALGACAAVATSAHALVTFAQADDPGEWRAAERARLETRLAAGLAVLATLHEHPFEASDRLIRAEALEAGAPPTADALLTLVARALDGHDALRIDAIAWSMPIAHERDAAFGDAATLPVRVTGPADGTGAGLDVELAGRVAAGLSVGTAERTVHAFIDALGNRPGVGSVLRLDSPLERAAQGGPVGRAATHDPGDVPPAAEPTWRVRFALADPGARP